MRIDATVKAANFGNLVKQYGRQNRNRSACTSLWLQIVSIEWKSRHNVGKNKSIIV